MMRCLNCGISVRWIQRLTMSTLALPLQARLARWLNNQLPLDAYICHPCFNLLNTEEADNVRLLGHSMVCRGCGVSVRRSRYYTIAADSPLLPIISNDYCQVNMTTIYACRACWTQGNRRLIQDSSRTLPHDVVPVVHHASLTPMSPPPIPPPLPPQPPLPLQPVNETSAYNIVVPNYKRTSSTSSRCIYNSCNNRTFHLIPMFIKKILIKEHNFYVPRSCRVCNSHLFSNEWHLLPQNTTVISTFNGRQIENMLNIAKSDGEVLDFNNVEEMPNNVCHYWTGQTVIEFLELYSSIPTNYAKQPKRALAIYLIKLRTGDSNRRLATLFNLSQSTIQLLLKNVRNCLNNNFVPQHIGPGHITHEQLINRNLRIPEALFGNPNAEHRSAIAMFDGTYIYMQKSSNYLFQKKTYSLHKYDNLVKPFVICSCDGHIIDVVGPYAATQSDAEIMKSLFQNDNSPLRNLFQPNDIFILDRGFRDAIPFLEEINYRVYKPESLDEGHHQLTFSQANKSRKVTLCRWVVEIINGRYKRDYKLFRHRYFNIASPNMMTDFRIAGALLNKFHPLIEDSPNAEEIIQRVQRYMDEPNHLGCFINDYNLNRRRVMFSRIDGNLPQLHFFPILEYNDLLLFALGPYQVKQARSYYGEHIRQNGIYHVEVCPELEHSEEMVLRVGGNHPYLVRGRIKSRHVTQKIYFTYILIDREPSSNSALDAILGYYCNCIVGNRTVGCCCHVMTLVWYLGWARHQDNVIAPAPFLENVLVSVEEP